MKVGDLVLVEHPPIPMGVVGHDRPPQVAIYLGDDPDYANYKLDPVSRVRFISTEGERLVQKKYIIRVISSGG